MKILITAPLRQEVKIFKEYQKSLDALIIPDGYEADRFFVVNDCPEVIPMIRNAAYITHDTGDAYEKNEQEHIWTAENVAKMSTLRNMTIIYALTHGYDYWFSADTDLVLDPHTLEYLLAADRDIVSEVFWSDSGRGEWCNAWMYDNYTPPRIVWKNKGLFQVGMTGACTLVKRRVFEAGVGYAPIPNIRTTLVGEDRHFCVRAACAGFDMWLDTHCPATHLYTEAEYQKFKAREKDAERMQTGAAHQNRQI